MRSGQEILANLKVNRGLGSVFTFRPMCGILSFVDRRIKRQDWLSWRLGTSVL